MKYVLTHFLKKNLCALQVFLFALISRLVCACTRAQLRGNGYLCSWRAAWREKNE